MGDRASPFSSAGKDDMRDIRIEDMVCELPDPVSPETLVGRRLQDVEWQMLLCLAVRFEPARLTAPRPQPVTPAEAEIEDHSGYF